MKKLTKLFIIIIALTLLVQFVWNFPAVKSAIHSALDPSLGALLLYNATLGMILITVAISIILTVIQKFTIDHESMIALKKEQKEISEQMKQFKDHPQKLAELTKKQFTELTPKMFELSMQPTLYTFIPFVLLFRWFYEFFALHPVKILGILSWFWAYLIFSIVFSSIFRKLFKLP